MKRSYLLCTLFIFLPSLLEAYPYRFRKLIFIKNNTIARNIDLISDKHFLIEASVKTAIQEQYLFEEEKELFASSERSLLTILRQLAHNPTQAKIQLLWEWNDEQLQRPEVMKAGFLPYGGWQLRKEFAQDLNKKIVFVPADTYRFNRFLFLQFLYPKIAWYGQFKHHQLTEAMTFITDILYNSQSNPEKDLDAVKTINPDAYKWLGRLWKDYKELRLMPFYEKYIEPILKQNKEITIQQFMQQDSFEFFKGDFIEMILPGVMNFELLFKIFKSPAQHIIIYAGGRHCTDVAEELIKHFDFNEVIDIGIEEIPKEKENYRIALSSNAWDFIKEKPAVTLDRFKKNGLFKHTISEWYFKKLDKIEDYSLEQLLLVLKEGFSAYIDTANAQDENNMKTVLMRVVEKNDYKKSELLLKYGAYPNIKDAAGNTALIAAAQQDNETIIVLLLNHGADPCIKNNEGKQPIDYAKNTKIRTVLQEYMNKLC